MKIKLSKRQWENIGKTAGWIDGYRERKRQDIRPRAPSSETWGEGDTAEEQANLEAKRYKYHTLDKWVMTSLSRNKIQVISQDVIINKDKAIVTIRIHSGAKQFWKKEKLSQFKADVQEWIDEMADGKLTPEFHIIYPKNFTSKIDVIGSINWK